MDLGLLGCRVVVAGSSRGIGLAIAERFLAEGAAVAISGRDGKRLEAAVDRLGSEHADDRVVGRTGDLALDADARALVDLAVQAFGGVDAIVLSAGSGRAPGGWDIARED